MQDPPHPLWKLLAHCSGTFLRVERYTTLNRYSIKGINGKISGVFKKIVIKCFKNYRLIRFLLEERFICVQLRKSIILPGKLLYTGAYKYLMLYITYRKKQHRKHG